MKRATACLFSFLALSAACGAEPPPPATTPSTPPAASSESPATSSAAPPAASSAPAASAAPSASSAGAPPEPPGPGKWDSWTKDEKMAYMKSAVMPKMGPLFHDFDAKKYAEPRCGLCHAPGAKEGNFKMPNPALPKLSATPEAFKKLQDQHPEIFGFMAKQVEPTMAALLGKEPYDPKTQKGFGCFDCHTKK